MSRVPFTTQHPSMLFVQMKKPPPPPGGQVSSAAVSLQDEVTRSSPCLYLTPGTTGALHMSCS